MVIIDPLGSSREIGSEGWKRRRGGREAEEEEEEREKKRAVWETEQALLYARLQAVPIFMQQPSVD